MNNNSCSLEKNLEDSSYNLVIFGAGILGHTVMRVCNENNIKIVCFCDNSTDKQNTLLNNIPIYSLDVMKEKIENPIIIIAISNKNTIGLFVQQLENLELKQYYIYNVFFDSINTLYNYTLPIKKNIHYSILEMEYYRNNIDKYEDLKIKAIELLVTEKCTLKCYNCANLMQYYKNPVHVTKENLFIYIDKISEIFDHVTVLRLLGGEPLMYKEIYDVIEYAQSKKNIKFIEIITNGTILPTQENLNKIDNKKVLFYISDYGNLSIRKQEIFNTLDDLAIEYEHRNPDYWFDLEYFKNQNYNQESLENLYSECSLAKGCNTLSNGKLYICSYLANVDRLKALPSNFCEHIDILDENIDLNLLKENIKNYLYKSKYIEGCKYCSGFGMGANLVEKAIQTKTPRDYKIYE